MVDEFVEMLEADMGIKRTRFSFIERWARCRPPEANGKSLKTYLAKVRLLLSSPGYDLLGQSGFYPFFYDGYHEYDQFREDYEKKYGKPPYVNPYMQFRWSVDSVLLCIFVLAKVALTLLKGRGSQNYQRRARSRSGRITSVSRLVHREHS